MGPEIFNGSQVLTRFLDLEKMSSDPANQKRVFQGLVQALSFFSQVQQRREVWRLLSSFPDVFRNDTSLSGLFGVLQKANRVLLVVQKLYPRVHTDEGFSTLQKSVKHLLNTLDSPAQDNLRLLQSTVRFRKSVLQNGSYEDDFPPFPEVLKSKLSQLRNLTELLCESETISSIEKSCQLTNMSFGRLCEDHTFHLQLIEAAELGADIATGLLYHDNVISAKLRDLLTGDPSKINLNMDWLLEQALQMNYLENITQLIPTVEAMLHVNRSADASKQPGQLIEMFKNIEELKEELRAIGMSNTSIDKMLAIPIPDNRAENTLRNPFVQVFVKFSVGLDAVELLKQIDDLDVLRLKLENNIDIIDQLNTLSSLTVNISSCVLYDRIQAADTVEEMEMVAEKLYKSNELFGSVIFKLPSNRSSHRGYDSENVSLPPIVKYTIRMSLKTAQTTRSIRTKIWAPGPHNSPSHNQIYSRAFIYLQDSIERAIIELQTGRNSQEVAVQVQAVPYPCFMKDNFLTSVSYSLPIVLMVAWVVFIAAFVKKLVYEKDLRLHEYMKMMGVNSCSHFFAWLIESVGFLLVTIAILIIILKFGNILPKTNGFILFLYFSDYSFSVIAMSYLISVFFNNTNIAALIGSLIYVIAFFPFIVLGTVEDELSYVIKVFMSLLSPTAFSYASQYIARYEEQGVGTYGMAAPWYFPVLPSYWKERFGCSEVKREKSNGLMFTNIMMQNTNPSANKTSPDCAFPSNIEPEPKDLQVGVALHGVTKIYGSKTAVQNLNLNFYEGHITSLLGPNGAGKTTTISMLTGLFGASAGTIFVYGKDIKTDLNTVRKNMGVCMQHDVLFSYLTTKEHLLLYGSIKVPHWTKKQLHEEVKRTIILSTHHLDEAEVLSDRIAFLEQGGLRCCGSPFYLKEAFGDGYHLTLTKKKSPNLDTNAICDTVAVTAMIQSHLPEAYLKEDIGGELVYVLSPFSTKVSGAYLSLLRALDKGMGKLNIGCYGISDTTVEEVFLNLTKDSQKSGNMSLEHLTQRKVGNPSVNGISTPDDLSVSSSNFTDRDDKVLTRSEKLDGFGLLMKKIMAILIKRFHHTRRNWKGLIAQVILPIVFVATAMGLGTLRDSSNSYPEIMISPSIYGTSEQTAFYAQCLQKDSLGKWNTSGEAIDNFGVCSCSDNVQVWYDPEGYHSLPAYLNSLNNFLLRVNMSEYDAARHGIIMYSHPYPGVQDQEQATISSLIDILVALSILMGYSVTTASFVTYIVREHQTKAKQLQHISGIGVTCYWVTNFIYDMVFYLVPVAFSIGVIAIFKLPAFYSENNLGAVSLLLLLFGYATFSWMYLLAGLFHETGMAFITYVCVNLFFGINSIVSLSVVYFLSKEKPNDPTLELISETLKRIFLIFPQFCFGYGLIELSQQQAVLDFLKAYGVEYPSETFEMDKLGAMFVALVSQGTMFFLLRLLLNEWLIKKLRSLGHVDSHSSLVGYCPQEDALDDLVTVEEHLYFYARVHGIPEKDIKETVHKLLRRLHLMPYKDRSTSMCSYGTKRKLSTALALIGKPSILLLDQHLSMLEYHVPVTAGGVANIFDLLETNKTALNITNFLVSQTTLEEVFINFAKDQKSYENADTSSHGSTLSVDSQDDRIES
ncbi:hypothetical protein NN561_002848 [Cricetulus griseus]